MEFEITPEGQNMYDGHPHADDSHSLYGIEISTTDIIHINTLSKELSREVIENISPYHYIRIITNIMHVVEKYYYRKKMCDYEKCSLVVSILHELPELNDLRDMHYSMVEELYMLMNNNRMKRIKRMYDAQPSGKCCIIC